MSERITAVADARGFPPGLAGGPARHRPRLDPGVLPGGGTTLSRLRSLCARKKKIARDPSRFAAARSRAWLDRIRQHAGAQTSFIPMLTLGIPGNAVMALMIGRQ